MAYHQGGESRKLNKWLVQDLSMGKLTNRKTTRTQETTKHEGSHSLVPYPHVVSSYGVLQRHPRFSQSIVVIAPNLCCQSWTPLGPTRVAHVYK